MNEDYAFHPLADAFPLIEGDDFAGFVENIRKHGQREPITLYEGKILDGRNRYRACIEAGIKPVCGTFDGTFDEARDFVISANFHRRHNDKSQLAMAMAKIEKLTHGGDRKQDQDAKVHLETREHLAKKVKVSTRIIASAAKVLKEGSLELVQAVEQGKIKVGAAEKQIKAKVAPVEPPAPVEVEQPTPKSRRQVFDEWKAQFDNVWSAAPDMDAQIMLLEHLEATDEAYQLLHDFKIVEDEPAPVEVEPVFPAHWNLEARLFPLPVVNENNVSLADIQARAVARRQWFYDLPKPENSGNGLVLADMILKFVPPEHIPALVRTLEFKEAAISRLWAVMTGATEAAKLPDAA
jgi:hypothetical protein